MREGYAHVEAFCLMLYKCAICGVIEILYNSRDGVTPMFIPCRNQRCNRKGTMSSPMAHAHWDLDTRMPAFSPWPGMRIFRDGTPEEARHYLRSELESRDGTEYEVPRDEWDAWIAESLADRFQSGWPNIELVGLE